MKMAIPLWLEDIRKDWKMLQKRTPPQYIYFEPEGEILTPEDFARETALYAARRNLDYETIRLEFHPCPGPLGRNRLSGFLYLRSLLPPWQDSSCEAGAVHTASPQCFQGKVHVFCAASHHPDVWQYPVLPSLTARLAPVFPEYTEFYYRMLYRCHTVDICKQKMFTINNFWDCQGENA